MCPAWAHHRVRSQAGPVDVLPWDPSHWVWQGRGSAAHGCLSLGKRLQLAAIFPARGPPWGPQRAATTRRRPSVLGVRSMAVSYTLGPMALSSTVASQEDPTSWVPPTRASVMFHGPQVAPVTCLWNKARWLQTHSGLVAAEPLGTPFLWDVAIVLNGKKFLYLLHCMSIFHIYPISMKVSFSF